MAYILPATTPTSVQIGMLSGRESPLLRLSPSPTRDKNRHPPCFCGSTLLSILLLWLDIDVTQCCEDIYFGIWLRNCNSCIIFGNQKDNYVLLTICTYVFLQRCFQIKLFFARFHSHLYDLLLEMEFCFHHNKHIFRHNVIDKALSVALNGWWIEFFPSLNVFCIILPDLLAWYI